MGRDPKSDRWICEGEKERGGASEQRVVDDSRRLEQLRLNASASLRETGRHSCSRGQFDPNLDDLKATRANTRVMTGERRGHGRISPVWPKQNGRKILRTQQQSRCEQYLWIHSRSELCLCRLYTTKNRWSYALWTCKKVHSGEIWR